MESFERDVNALDAQSSRPARGVQQPSSWMRPKFVLFGVVGLMLAYVLVHNESFLVHREDPIWQHYQPFKWWLLPHGLAGACTILLGPFQFSERLRRRYAKLHRVVGRVYVAGAMIAAPLGAFIQYYFDERQGFPRSFSVASAVNATLLMVTTGLAFYFIRQGKVQQHRAWMTRSYAVALAFLDIRVIGGVTHWDDLGVGAIETIVWTCNALAILLADIVLEWQELHRSPLAARKVRAQNSPAASLFVDNRS